MVVRPNNTIYTYPGPPAVEGRSHQKIKLAPLSNAWCFTLNNPNVQLDFSDTTRGVVFAVWQYERGDSGKRTQVLAVHASARVRLGIA